MSISIEELNRMNPDRLLISEMRRRSVTERFREQLLWQQRRLREMRK